MWRRVLQAFTRVVGKIGGGLDSLRLSVEGVVMTEISPQQFGELKATVTQLEHTTDNLDKDMRALNAGMKELMAQLNQARGGWKALLIVASIGVAIANLANLVLGNIAVRP